ncbi:MAG: Hsp20/alpha crystallin family protein [Rudaea sp.]
MNTIANWNPFKTTTRYNPVASFEDLFRGLNARPLWRDIEAAPDMRIDVNEDDKAYRVKAEMPGVDKNDIEISVEGNQVAISAEVKRETTKKDDEKELYTERYFGKVYRSLSLASDLDGGKAEAHYDKGVLTLTLPKKHNGGTRKVAVS